MICNRKPIADLVIEGGMGLVACINRDKMHGTLLNTGNQAPNVLPFLRLAGR